MTIKGIYHILDHVIINISCLVTEFSFFSSKQTTEIVNLYCSLENINLILRKFTFINPFVGI